MSARPQKVTKPTALIWIVALLVGSVAVGLAVWWMTSAGKDEFESKRQLAELGALVAMDADGRHVGTVTLSTVTDISRVRKALEIVATLQQVKAIDLSRMAIDNSDLQALANCSSLVSLSLKSTEIDDDGLKTIANLPRLESLHLNNTDVSDAGLEHLAMLTRLKLLDLSGTQVSSDLTPIAGLPQLEWLVLGELTLDENALTPLGQAPMLSRLTLRNSQHADSAVDQLRRDRASLSIDE